MGTVNQPEDLLSRINDLERQIADMRRRVGLNSAVLTNGLSVRTGESGTRLDIGSSAITIVGNAASDDSAPKIVLKVSDVATTMGRLQASPFGDGTSVDLSVRRVSDGLVDGGKVVLYRDGVLISHQPNGGEETLIGLGWPYTGKISMWGKWPNVAGGGPVDALNTGAISLPGTSSGVTIGYGATMASVMAPVTTVVDNPGTPYAHVVSSNSSTGFTVSLAVNSNGAWTLNFWAFRT